MAVEVEAAGQVDEFLRILGRRIWWIIIPVAIIGSLGAFFAVVVPKKYVVETSVMVRDGDEQTGRLGQSASAIEGAVAKINITSSARIDTVLNAMRIDGYESMKDADRIEFRDDILKDLRVSTPTMAREADQQLVEITFQHTDPQKAFDFVDRLRESWTSEVLERHLARERTELTETREKLNDLVKERAKVNDDLTVLRTEHHIPPPSETELLKNNSLPASFKEEEDINKLCRTLRAEIEELDLEIERRKNDWASMPPLIESVAVNSSRGVKSRLEEIDEQILGLQDQIRKNDYSPSNSNYQLLQKRIADLRDSRREVQTERVQFETTDLVENKQRSLLRAEIDKQEFLRDQKARQLANSLNRLAELEDKNEELQGAITEARALERKEASLSEEISLLRIRSNELDIRVQKLQSPEGDPFEILKHPVVPNKATSPNPYVIAFGSIFFGLALGFGLAILKEYSKSCFRSARELNRVMTHPVLGTINAIRTRRERARAFLLRSVLGGGSLLFVISVGYVTWAFAKKQEALTDPLKRAIQSFQEMLK